MVIQQISVREELIMKILHLTTLSLAVIGLIIMFGSNMRWFTERDKVDFLKNISKGIDPEHPAAQKFLKEFFYSLQISEEEKNIAIEKIIFVGTFTKHGADHKDLMSGTIKVRNHKGETSSGLCSLAELEAWTKTTPFWDWFAWGILAFSVAAEIAMYIITVKRS